jgi:acyl-CoA thioester hydrolase
MWYVGKFDEASWQLLHTLGLTRSRMKADGIVMAAVEQHLQYKRELHAGDAITIRSSILAVTDKSIRMVHEMSNDETQEIVATTVTVGLHVDAKLRKACTLPSDVRARALSKREPERAGDHSGVSDVLQFLVDEACGASSGQ